MTDTIIPGKGPTYRVSFRDIERELNRQMKELQGDRTAPLQRARMSNLVIFCDNFEDSILLNEQIPTISAVHPARVILLVGEKGPDREPSARVTVRPIGRGDKPYACAEQVTVHCGGTAVDRLPFAVRALVIGDLPINLLWSTHLPPSLGGALLYELSENAQQIIYDSLGWPDPARGVAGTAAWLEQTERVGHRWRVASDLNWRRLKYWRRLLTQSLDEASAPGAANSVREILVEHGPHASVQGWLLLSWLTRQLNMRVQSGRLTPGVEMAWNCTGPLGDAKVKVRRLEQGPPEITHVNLVCTLDGKPVTLELNREGPSRLSTLVQGIDTKPRTITVPPQTVVDLIGRQLSDRERDPVFRETMSVAEVMAQSLLI